MNNNQLLNQILHEYEIKRNKAISNAEEKKRELISVNPKLAQIESEISKNSISATKALLISNKKEQTKILNELKKSNAALIKEKNSFIKELYKDTSYLKPKFECIHCKDTGFVTKNNQTTMCSCLKQRLFNEYYNKSNIGNLEKENFAKFNSKLFSDISNKDLYKSDLSPKQNIEVLKSKAENFIKNFDSIDEKNLFFSGSTGVGKTFLTNCIANEILKQGKTVLYQTAPVMFDEINEAKFEKNSSNFDLYENILNVDLLIIDDLGTEKITDTKITELFTIINTRLLNQSHHITKTIISTNLNIDEVFKNYTTRIGSRLAGSYRFLRFYGDDLRFKQL